MLRRNAGWFPDCRGLAAPPAQSQEGLSFSGRRAGAPRSNQEVRPERRRAAAIPWPERSRAEPWALPGSPFQLPGANPPPAAQILAPRKWPESAIRRATPPPAGSALRFRPGRRPRGRVPRGHAGAASSGRSVYSVQYGMAFRARPDFALPILSRRAQSASGRALPVTLAPPLVL